LIVTPGRLLDLVKQGYIDLFTYASSGGTDQMLDMDL
jgi:superfamily II DNA/RNA helicase